jgi:hypothetical protein
MTTGLKIVERGASKAKIKTAGIPLSDEEYADGLDVLNDIIKEWSALGVLQGVKTINSLDVDLMEPEYATPALKAQVGMMMIVEYGYQGDLSVAASAATKSYRTMLIAKPKIPIVYPDTLPKGSGNHDGYYDYWDNDFFPHNQKDNF